MMEEFFKLWTTKIFAKLLSGGEIVPDISI